MLLPSKGLRLVKQTSLYLLTCSEKSQPVIIWKAPQMKTKRSFRDEEDTIQRRADDWGREAAEGWASGSGDRPCGVSEQTLYNWRAKYSGLEVSEAKRLRELEDENRRLKTT